MRRDYYAVLGVTATAAPREIRQAYRRLARQYSPDINVGDGDARSLFAEIEEAYRTLIDPARRAMYDRFGSGVHGGVGVLQRPRRGEDVHASIELSFAEAASGVAVTLPVGRCSPCRACAGPGVLDGRPCPHCDGRGVRRIVEAVHVRIPAGVDSGTQVRVAGEGDAGPRGGPRGDLLVATRVREHPFFRRKGDAIHCEVGIGVWEALLGTRIRVPTPTEDVLLTLPPGLLDGRTVRLRGQGMPRLSGPGNGDLHVTFRIEVPGGLDAHALERIRELERMVPVAVREGLDRYRGGAE